MHRRASIAQESGWHSLQAVLFNLVLDQGKRNVTVTSPTTGTGLPSTNVGS